MNLNSLLKVEDSDFYINLAFKQAKEKANSLKHDIKKQKSVVEKAKTLELTKIEVIKNSLTKNLGSIIKNFPKFSELNPFYQELLSCYVDVTELKKSLSSVAKAITLINNFYIKYSLTLKKARTLREINEQRKEFYGRTASVVKKIKRCLLFIEETRKIIRNFPSIKENIFTVAITGFPNVGKSTLLNKLTGANAKIADYAFTTKSLNLGYIFEDNRRIVQIIDTPGTLNRPDKMNNIEMQAHLAMKFCADIIVFVFDPLQEEEKQIKLIKKIKNYKKKSIIYVSKTDIASIPEKIKKFDFISSVSVLKERILQLSKNKSKEKNK